MGARRHIALLAIALGLLPAGAGACPVASHVFRLFLGWSARGPVYVELDLRRDVSARSRDEFGPVTWRGGATVQAIGPRGPARVRSLPLPSEIKEARLDEAIGAAYRAGLAAARALGGFTPSGWPRHLDCEQEDECGAIRLEPGDAGALQVIAGGDPPITIPAATLRRLKSDPDESDADLAGSLGISRALFYPRPGEKGGVLVLAVGHGDERWPDRDVGVWPPCDCRSLERCLPIAPTLHHGNHMELVLPVRADVPGAPAEPSPPARWGLSPAELSSAEKLESKPRLRGIYATAPACERGGWDREFVRLFKDGHAHVLGGNQSPRTAFRAVQRHAYSMPEGTWRLDGSRLRIEVTLYRKEQEEKRRYEGLVVEGGLVLRVTEPDGKARIESFRFIPETPEDDHDGCEHKVGKDEEEE